MNFNMIKFMLGFADVPSEDVNALQANAPALARLVQTSQDLKPLVEMAMPHIQALELLYEQASPHIQALLPLVKTVLARAVAEKADVDAVLPMFLKLVKDINTKDGT